MATAIEYGLVAALIAVAAVGVAQCSFPDSKKEEAKHIAYDPDVLKELGNSNPSAVGSVWEDVQTGCHYLTTGTGITIRYTKAGIIDCPQTVSVSLSQFNTRSTSR